MQPDDALAEMVLRAEVAQFAIFLWEVGARKTNADLPEAVLAAPAGLPVDDTWPDSFRTLIRSCSRPDLEPKLTMREVLSRVKRIMFGLEAEEENGAASKSLQDSLNS